MLYVHPPKVQDRIPGELDCDLPQWLPTYREHRDPDLPLIKNFKLFNFNGNTIPRLKDRQEALDLTLFQKPRPPLVSQ